MPGVSISDAATRKEESLSTALYDFNGKEGELSFVVYNLYKSHRSWLSLNC